MYKEERGKPALPLPYREFKKQQSLSQIIDIYSTELNTSTVETNTFLSPPTPSTLNVKGSQKDNEENRNSEQKTKNDNGKKKENNYDLHIRQKEHYSKEAVEGSLKDSMKQDSSKDDLIPFPSLGDNQQSIEIDSDIDGFTDTEDPEDEEDQAGLGSLKDEDSESEEAYQRLLTRLESCASRKSIRKAKSQSSPIVISRSTTIQGKNDSDFPVLMNQTTKGHVNGSQKTHLLDSTSPSPSPSLSPSLSLSLSPSPSPSPSPPSLSPMTSPQLSRKINQSSSSNSAQIITQHTHTNHEYESPIAEKLGTKELIEYTKNQNELKYGKMIKIVDIENEKEKKQTNKVIPLINPIKLIHEHIVHHERGDKKEDQNSSHSSPNLSEVESTPEEKIMPQMVEFTEKQNRAKYKSMIPIKSEHSQVMSIVKVKITGYDRRYEPTKYYVYNIEITRDGVTYSIFRRFSEFFQLHEELTKEFPLALPPPLPPKILFGRSHIHSVSKMRMLKLDEFLQKLIGMKDTYAYSPAFQNFIKSSFQDIENDAFNRKLQERGVSFD